MQDVRLQQIRKRSTMMRVAAGILCCMLVVCALVQVYFMGNVEEIDTQIHESKVEEFTIAKYPNLLHGDFGVQQREDFGVQQQQDFGVQQREDFGVQQREDFGVQQREDFGVQQREDFGVQQREDFGVQQQQPDTNDGNKTQALVTTSPTMKPSPLLTPGAPPLDWPIGNFFAVHIGPSTTGTTAIQQETRDNPWGVNTLAEDKDNIIYVGTKNNKNMKDIGGNTTIRKVNGVYKTTNQETKQYLNAVECMKKIIDKYYKSTNDDIHVIDNRLENNKFERTLMKKQFIQECWKGSEYMLSYNLLDSNEEYSYDPNSLNSGSYLELGRRFRMFDILGFKRLVVVGAYRRYFEWVISEYTESIKTQCLLKNLEGQFLRKPCESLNEYLTEVSNRTGDREFNTRFYHNLHLTLPTIVEMGPTKLESKVLNYFQLPHGQAQIPKKKKRITGDAVKVYQSILTEFYCDALGDDLTPHTCNHYKALEKESKPEVAANKGATSPMAYQSVVTQGHRLGYIAKSENKKFQNTTTWKDLSDYHSMELGLNWIDTMPLQCLTFDKLNSILEESLKFEELIMPGFYASDMGKEELLRLFWDVKKNKFFCWVDIEKLFYGANSWDEIVNERIVSHNWPSV